MPRQRVQLNDVTRENAEKLQGEKRKEEGKGTNTPVARMRKLEMGRLSGLCYVGGFCVQRAGEP